MKFIRYDIKKYKTMVCGYCGDKDHNISHCPRDNDLVNLLYSSEDVDFNSLSYKTLRKIASKIALKTTLPKNKLVTIFNEIKKEHTESSRQIQECAVCYETIGQTNRCTTQCGHTFCMTCILQLVRTGSSISNSCPLCRSQLLEVGATNGIVHTPPPHDNFESIIRNFNNNESQIHIIEPIELFPEPSSVTVTTSYDNNNIGINDINNNNSNNYFEDIYNSRRNTINNDDIDYSISNNINNNINNNNNNIRNNINNNSNNDDDYDNNSISEIDIVNLLSNNMENRRLNFNDEEYRVRQQYINERYITQATG
jgi:hypothetical protein